MKDRTGDRDDLQEEYDALLPRKQLSASWLQETLRAVLLYYLDKPVSSQMWVTITELLRTKRAADESMEWKDALDIISRQLVNADAKFLLETIVSILRDEGMPLVTWCQDFQLLTELCEEARISLPTYL